MMENSDLLEASVLIEIMHLRNHGGVTDWHISEAQKQLRFIRDKNIAEAMQYKSEDTRDVFRAYVECIAVMAFCPGGITFGGRHFEAMNTEPMTGREAVLYDEGQENTEYIGCPECGELNCACSEWMLLE
jgi:hypothetical protein